MNKQLQNKTPKNICIFLFVFGFWFIPAALNAQMSGNYTINSANSASGTNFRNWQSFWQSLQGSSRADAGPTFTGGVSGPVTVEVQSSITETVAVQFAAVTGTSSTNTITINGNNNMLSFAGTTATPAAIFANGIDFLRIQNLVIRNTGTATNVMGIRFTNASDNNIVQNCTLEFSGITTGSSTAGGAYVAFAATTSLTGVTAGTGTNGFNNIIRNNLMRTTNGNSPGPAYGIFEVQNTSTYTSTASNNTFENNTIQNFFFWGINTYYTNGTHIIKNDISRASVTSGNPNSTSGGINSYYNYATGRSLRADSNYIHDLPFSGSVPSSSNASMHGMWVWYWYGSSSNPFTIKGNRVMNLTSATSSQGVYEGYGTFGKIEENRVENLRSNASSNMFGVYSIYGSSKDLLKNVIQNNRPFGTYYGMYTFGIGGSGNKIHDNIVKDNVSQATTTYHIMYGIYNANGDLDIQRNLVYNLTQITSAGYVYGLFSQINGASQLVANNVVSNCGGSYGTYGFYHNTVNNSLVFRQNTINLNVTGGGYSFHYSYAIYGFGSGSTTIEGNIISATNTYCSYMVYYGGSTANPPTFRNNLYWASNFTLQYWYNPLMGVRNSINDWTNSGLGSMSGELFSNPLLVNPGSGDFGSRNFLSQNNVPEDTRTSRDLVSLPRNSIMCDRGAVRSMLDIENTSVTYNGGTSPCTGYKEKLKITVKNKYSDSTRGFNVAFSINGKLLNRERINRLIPPGETFTYEFQTPLHFTQSGATRLAVYVEMPDDVRANDSQIFNLMVKKSPGGSVLSPAMVATKAVYQQGKKFDVTVAKSAVIYNLTAPTGFVNSEYGSKWVASAYALTAGGVSRPASEIVLTAPGTGDLTVQWKTDDRSIEDTNVFVCIKFSNLVNGCDTVVNRQVLLYPSIEPDFKFPAKICDQDFVLFENLSKVKSGFMEYTWNFGTTNAADTSNAPEPVFSFPTHGKYRVIMEAKTKPYGFSFFDTAFVVVNPIPVVAFSKINACAGNNLVFNNKTTPTNSQVSWDFGDGTKSTTFSPAKRYNNPGSYVVTLKATLNGCSDELKQRVYQFEKPVSKFDLQSGSCENDKFIFENKSVLNSGNLGSFWTFEPGKYATDRNSEFTFSSSGSKTVKLVSVSEFGCKDSVSKTIVVKPTAKPAYIVGETCMGTPVNVLNTTLDVPGTIANYKWEFEGAGTSTAKSPQVTFGNLGPRKIKLTVNLDNGCSTSEEREVSVGVKPKADFMASDVCVGNPVVFRNKTSWPQGRISYSWKFGDGAISTATNPSKAYSDNISTQYFVTLKASVENGCSDSVIKPINIFEGPKNCDFVSNIDYKMGFRGMKFLPVNNNGQIVKQPGIEYTWIIENNGSFFGDTAAIDFQLDGEYIVTMRAKSTATNCECSKTKTVVMNRSGLQGFAELGVKIHPNPSQGILNVNIPSTVKVTGKMELLTISGQAVLSWNVNAGLNVLDLQQLSAGIYFLKMNVNGKIQSQKIEVIK